MCLVPKIGKSRTKPLKSSSSDDNQPHFLPPCQPKSNCTSTSTEHLSRATQCRTMWRRIASAISLSKVDLSQSPGPSRLTGKQRSNDSSSPLMTVSTEAGQQNADAMLSPSERVLRACTDNNLDVLREILDIGEQQLIPGGPSKYEMSMEAARSRSFEVLRYLLESLPMLEMDLEFHQAAFDGGPEVYGDFLQTFPDMKNLDISDLGGPIPHAVLKNNALFLLFLLRQGFNQDCLEKLKQSSTSQNLQDVDQEVVSLLNGYGLSLEGTNAPAAYPPSPYPLLEKTSEKGNQERLRRRMSSAIHKKRPSVIRYILAQHPEFYVDLNTYRDGFHAGQEIFNILLEFQPDLLNRHWTMSHMGQALGVTVFVGDYEYTKFLLEKGADPNRSYTIGGSSVLACAIGCESKPEIVQLLKSYGATIKGKGNLG